jgi:hypothetical protein
MKKSYKMLCIKDVGGFDFKKGCYYDCYESIQKDSLFNKVKYVTIKCNGYSLGTPDSDDGRKFLKEYFKPLWEVRKEKLEKLRNH